jgi:hypothetical protein
LHGFNSEYIPGSGCGSSGVHLGEMKTRLYIVPPFPLPQLFIFIIILLIPEEFEFD